MSNLNVSLMDPKHLGQFISLRSEWFDLVLVIHLLNPFDWDRIGRPSDRSAAFATLLPDRLPDVPALSQKEVIEIAANRLGL